LSGSGTLTFTVAGERMAFGTDVRLRRTGQPDVVGVSVEAQGDLLRARFNTSGLAEGWWRLLLTNPDGQRTVLYNAFVVPQIFYSEDFETDNIAGRGWTFVAALAAQSRFPDALDVLGWAFVALRHERGFGDDCGAGEWLGIPALVQPRLRFHDR
jgi:hypothetical protein